MRGSKVEYEQGSQEWLWARINLFTASEVSNLMWEQKTLKSGKLSDVITGIDPAIKYIQEKVAGNFLEALPEEASSKTLEWGTYWEDDARYELLDRLGVDSSTIETKTAYFDKENLLLVSPDGLAKDNSFGIEIKCPFTLSAFAHAKLNVKDNETLLAYKKEYYWQVMANLYVTGADKWLFVNYFPYIKSENRLGIAEIYPDAEAFALLQNRLSWAKDQYQQMLKKF